MGGSREQQFYSSSSGKSSLKREFLSKELKELGELDLWLSGGKKVQRP